MEYLNFAITYWPFLVVTTLLAVVGLFFDRQFTRGRAYVFDAKGNKIAKRFFWYAMRESLPLHPIGVGFVIGVTMAFLDASPGPIATTRPLIVLYFTGAGVAALVLWVYAKARLKGIPLPGDDSLRPPGSGVW